MRKPSLFVLLFLLLCGTLNAQYLAKIHGKVSDSLGYPIEGASVLLRNYPNLGTSTNESGRFELLVPHQTDIIVEVSCLGYSTKEYRLTVPKGKRHSLEVVLSSVSYVMPEFRVVERYSITDNDLKPINAKVMTHLPGLAQGVENLVKSAGLGVSSNNEMTSQYNVRGGNYDENLVYLNGTEIYRPLLIRSGNQEGLSFINPDLVSMVDFSAGGFDACYGDKMASVLDVRYKLPVTWSGSVSGSIMGASGHVAGASKNEKLSFLAGVRYQSNAYLFSKMQDSGSYRPNFADVQLLLNYKATDKWTLSLFGNYTNNTYQLTPTSRETNIGTVNDVQRFKVYFEGQEVDAYQTIFASFSAKYAIDTNNSLKFTAAYFNSIEKETFDILSQYYISTVNASMGDDDYGEEISSRSIGSDMYHGRNFLTSHIFHVEMAGEHRLPKSNTLTWGLKAQGELIYDDLLEWRLYDSAGYSLPFYPTVPGDSVPLDDISRRLSMGDTYVKAKQNLESARLSGFVQDRWAFGSEKHRFYLIGGLRFSYWSYNNEFLATPRLRMVYHPKIEKKNIDMSFYLATGMYFQPPFYKEMRRTDGSLNASIKSQKSYHIIAGMDMLFKIARRPFKWSTEIYYKYLDDLITYSLDNVRVIYSAMNDASGFATGIDMKLSGEIVHGLESWISVSLMKSMELIDGETKYTPRPTDQRFSFNLFFQDRVPRLPMLKAHLNLVYATPLPYSFPTQRAYTNRSKSYFRADLGLSWQFIDEATRIGKMDILKFIKAAFLTFEVINIFNYSNVLSYTWAKDLNGLYYGVPNHLTPRLFNVKLRFEF